MKKQIYPKHIYFPFQIYIDGESNSHEKQEDKKSKQKTDEFKANIENIPMRTKTETDVVEPETKIKRKRKLKTTEQRKYLRYYYENESQFPTKKERHQISGDLRISYDEVSQWFLNQRAAERKKAREEEETLTMVSIQSWENIYRGGGNAGRRGIKKK